MARGPNEKAAKAYELYKSGMKLVEVAQKLGVPAGTVRRWKSTYCWDGGQKGERSERKEANARKENKGQGAGDKVGDAPQDRGLTDKQWLFCQFYIKYHNKTKAYQKAFKCSYECACGHASELWKKVEIQNEVSRLLEEYRNNVELDIKDLIQWHLDIARADITDYLDFGNKEVSIIDPGTGEKGQVKVSYVNIKDSSEVDGTLLSEVSKGRDGVKVKLADRMKAMQWLSDHMDLATEEQKARIAVLRAKVEASEEGETADDGFMDALNASAGDDWSDEKD